MGKTWEVRKERRRVLPRTVHSYLGMASCVCERARADQICPNGAKVYLCSGSLLEL